MNPSLFEMLSFNFAGDLDQVNEREQVIISVLDNMQRILNSRAGSLAHLPDYGLPDMSEILQGLPATAHRLMAVLKHTLLKYEPRLKDVELTLMAQRTPGHLRYTLEAELKQIGLVRFGTEFIPEGRVLVRHLRQRGQELNNRNQ